MEASSNQDLLARLASLAGQLGHQEWSGLFEDRSGAWKLATELPKVLAADRVSTEETPERDFWQLTGAYYRGAQRFHDAIAIYRSMYEHFLTHQLKTQSRIHKGMPLVWLADCYLGLGNIPLSKRFLMLTLIEDAIQWKGNIDPTGTGSYFRLAWRHGMPDVEFRRYATGSFEISAAEPVNSLFPEYILQELDSDWLVELPTPNDSSIYVANTLYIKELMRALGEPSGKVLERLAEYLVSCVPGCRTTRRARSGSTDFDIMCSFEGPALDFRGDIGSYFICECKDWNKRTDFTVFAKFARVLDSIKAPFGILFSSEGITGQARFEGARLDQMKVFQDRGMIIVVVDSADLDLLAIGANFVTILRRKYEEVRLDLRGEAPARA